MKPDFIARNPALIEALGIVVDREFDQIPILDEFSPEFERKMEQLIRAERRPYYRFTNTHAKKALLALAATFILFVTMVFSVSAIRQPFIRFVVETFEKFSSILFHTDDADVQLPTTIEQNFLPHWLPKGYVLDETNNLKTDLYCFHAFNKGDVTISFEQYVITSIQLQVDTEGVYGKLKLQQKGLKSAAA